MTVLNNILSSAEDTTEVQFLDKRDRCQEIIMDHSYVTLPSDSSGYFTANTIADFRTKLATPLELEHGKGEVGLIEISYLKRYKVRSLHNTFRLDSEEIIFPVKHYVSVFGLLTNIPRFYEPL